MRNKILKSINDENLENLSKQELILAFKNAKLETFKYVNKFLELEEKWAFINLLLKKLNSVRQKGVLCKTITDGFLKLTDSKICYCCLFNQDNSIVEFSKISYSSPINNEEFDKFITVVNKTCCKFLETGFELADIQEYFKSLCNKNKIIVPIIYSDSFLGYLMLKKESDNFYEENINFVNIFPEHIALILENISLYNESEKQNKRKVEFLAGISHEFKTPLNSVIGFAEILESENENSKNFKYINNILKSSRHLLTLIEDVIDVSKSQYKNLELNYTSFNPKIEIVQILQALDEMIKEKNIGLTYAFADLIILADLKRFRQLIYNLVSNAIKFNKTAGKINIITYLSDNKFFFEITDTGDGISKRDHEKIFDFFSQVNRSQLKRQLGSGVGLALCKEIVEAHGGTIDFKSQLRKGSSFWFSLPLK